MTTHDKFRGELVAFLSGDLDGESAESVRQHLETCDDCRRELDSIRNVWQSLGNVTEEAPGERISERFRAALRAYEETLRGPVTTPDAAWHPGHRTAGPVPAWIDRLGWLIPRHPAVQFALVLAVLIVGGYIGYGIHSSGARNDEIAQLREEVRSVSRLLIVSLLQQQTATERLQGVNWTYKVDHSDPEITGALLQTLSQDPNVNVRLAALDALTRNIDQPAVRGGLMKALEKQSSPMIQLAIVDLVVRSDMKESAGVLRELLKKPEVNEVVKNRIEEALQYLNI